MRPINRRRFLQWSAAAGAAVLLSGLAPSSIAGARGVRLRKYVQPLPLPGAGIVVMHLK